MIKKKSNKIRRFCLIKESKLTLILQILFRLQKIQDNEEATRPVSAQQAETPEEGKL